MPIAPAPVEWRPLPEDKLQPAATIQLVIDHSIVGSAEGAYGFFLNSTNLESHFIIKKNGHIIQLINTDRSADANYHVNRIAISIETEDNGNPNTDPWTPEQIEALIWLHDWAVKAHPKIKRQKAPQPYGEGLGYHSMFGAPSEWTPAAGKTCPGTIRIKQWNNVLLPRFIKGPPSTKPESSDPAREEIDMVMYHDEARKRIYLDRGGKVKDITAYSNEFWQLAGPGRVPVVKVSSTFVDDLMND